MKRKAGRPKAGKSLLSKDAIIDVAMRIVDEDGIEAFSMRKLAARLDVNPMAIYYHLKNKKAVLDELVRKTINFEGFAAFTASTLPEKSWKSAVKDFARYYLDLFRSHRDLMLYLIVSPSSESETVQVANEILYSILQAGGLSPINVVRATDVIVDYLNGYGLADSTGKIPDHNERLLQLNKWLETPPSDNYPVTRNIIQSINGSIATDFELGLDCILAGIDRWKAVQ